jgi:hypothetical protein
MLVTFDPEIIKLTRNCLHSDQPTFRNQLASRTSRYKTSPLPISTPRLTLSLLHPSTYHIAYQIHPSSHIRLILLLNSDLFSILKSQNPSKCLPKPLLRRSPPPLARPQPAKLPPRRRKLARRPPLPPQATRRSVARPGRRPTLRTSTRVSLIAISTHQNFI